MSLIKDLRTYLCRFFFPVSAYVLFQKATDRKEKH